MISILYRCGGSVAGVLGLICGNAMASANVTKMLAALARSPDPNPTAEVSKRFGRALFAAPVDAMAVLTTLVRSTVAGAEEEGLGGLLVVAPDGARVAQENGRQRGAG